MHEDLHGYGSHDGWLVIAASSSSPRYTSDLEQARPQTSGEEELQLQLALAMSREEAEKVRPLLGHLGDGAKGTGGGMGAWMPHTFDSWASLLWPPKP